MGCASTSDIDLEIGVEEAFEREEHTNAVSGLLYKWHICMHGVAQAVDDKPTQQDRTTAQAVLLCGHKHMSTLSGLQHAAGMGQT